DGPEYGPGDLQPEHWAAGRGAARGRGPGGRRAHPWWPRGRGRRGSRRRRRQRRRTGPVLSGHHGAGPLLGVPLTPTALIVPRARAAVERPGPCHATARLTP